MPKRCLGEYSAPGPEPADHVAPSKLPRTLPCLERHCRSVQDTVDRSIDREKHRSLPAGAYARRCTRPCDQLGRVGSTDGEFLFGHSPSGAFLPGAAMGLRGWPFSMRLARRLAKRQAAGVLTDQACDSATAWLKPSLQTGVALAPVRLFPGPRPAGAEGAYPVSVGPPLPSLTRAGMVAPTHRRSADPV